MSRPLLNKLGIRLPIIQAPMAAISTPAMAAAVSNAGGLGSIGVGNLDAEVARRMIADVRQLTDKPFNVNVFCHLPAVRDSQREAEWVNRLVPHFRAYNAEPPASLREIYKTFREDEAMVAMLIDESPAVVSFHFGLPTKETMQALAGAGIVQLANATNVREAQEIEIAGADAIVAQGFEAGGHRGVFDPRADDEQLPTAALVQLLVRESSLPIIAAGGIMNGVDIAAALALGASAAQLGTAFVACPESAADDGYRAAIMSEAAKHTTMTTAISGRLARSLVNRFTAIGDEVDAAEFPEYPVAYDAGKALHAAAKRAGEFGYGAQWAGTGAHLSRAIPTAQLIEKLEQELAAAK